MGITPLPIYLQCAPLGLLLLFRLVVSRQCTTNVKFCSGSSFSDGIILLPSEFSALCTNLSTAHNFYYIFFKKAHCTRGYMNPWLDVPTQCVPNNMRLHSGHIVAYIPNWTHLRAMDQRNALVFVVKCLCSILLHSVCVC